MQQQNDNQDSTVSWVEVEQVELAADVYNNCCHFMMTFSADENRS